MLRNAPDASQVAPARPPWVFNLWIVVTPLSSPDPCLAATSSLKSGMSLALAPGAWAETFALTALPSDISHTGPA